MYTLGRSESCTIYLPDKRYTDHIANLDANLIFSISLSGTHCKITKQNGGKAILEDLSTNGTFVNDQRVGKGMQTELKNGDVIHLLHPSRVSADGKSSSFLK